MAQSPMAPSANQQIVVGQYMYQPGDSSGGLVQLLTAVPPAATPQPVAKPVFIRPRPFRQMVGRQSEIAWAVALLEQNIPIELHSEAGMGRTVLLRHLAYHPIANHFPDGVVYLVASQELAEDLLHSLYTAFYQSAMPHKPSESDLRRNLQAKNALVILDDFDLGRDELDVLLNAAPLSTFLISSPSRSLYGDGEAKALAGLPPEDALALLEREWGRPLNPHERNDAEAICALLKGHPLRIQQAVTAVRDQQLSLHDALGRLRRKPAADSLSLPQLRQQILAAFDEGELQDLCFDLGVDYESLPAQGKANKARELIDLMARQGRLSNLMAQCAQIRPHLSWGEPAQSLVDGSVNGLPSEQRDVLSVLAAFGERPLSAELIGQLVGQADVSAVLEALMQRGLVQNAEYHLAGSLPHRFQSDLEPMLLFLVEWAGQQDRAVIQREAQTLAFLQQWAASNGRPAEALQLGRLLDGVLALDGRWGLWQQVLLACQQAAQSLPDPVAEAWALNQLGCRALCLGDKGVARIQLERAKALNEAADNGAGTAVNDHNLALLGGWPVSRSVWRRWVAWLFAAGVLLLLLWWAVWGRGTAVAPISSPTPTATSTPLAIMTERPLVTGTATDTASPTSSPTLTAVATETAVTTETAVSSATASASPTVTTTSTIIATAPPTAVNTIPPTSSPAPTDIPLPTPTLVPATPPTLISPERGTAHHTAILFQWRGVLLSGQQYRVQLRHNDSGFILNSPLLAASNWDVNLPAERFGEWRWEVAVVSNGATRAISDNWHFYLDPFRPSGPTSTPLPAPSATTPPITAPPTNTPAPPPPTNTPALPTPTNFPIPG